MASLKIIWIILIGVIGLFVVYASAEEDSAPGRAPIQTQAPIELPPVIHNAEAPKIPIPGGSVDGSLVGTAPVPGQKPGLLPSTSPSSPDGQGEVTQYRNPDGGVITVTRFNGNIPDNLLQPHLAGIYHPWNNPFLANPFGWPFGPQQHYQGGPRQFPDQSPIPVQEQQQTGTNKQKRSIPSASAAMKPTETRTSTNVHYPAPPQQYWATHKKPEVPLVYIDKTKLDHITGKNKQ